MCPELVGLIIFYFKATKLARMHLVSFIYPFLIAIVQYHALSLTDGVPHHFRRSKGSFRNMMWRMARMFNRWCWEVWGTKEFTLWFTVGTPISFTFLVGISECWHLT